MKKICFTIGYEKILGVLNNSKNALNIYSALPFQSTVNLWGKEIYFYVDIRLPLENGLDTVNIGDIAYWPEGPAICIFFGPTPISKEDGIKPYSSVSVIGKVDGLFIKNLYNIKSGEEIRMEPITNGGD
ncbi:MAG: cyclophilin-like fold protein [Candidatus Omnitrophica bacterium]|nr:cyclophilin-like fold protein [Candidatus Omnitrophota bacterium]